MTTNKRQEIETLTSLYMRREVEISHMTVQEQEECLKPEEQHPIARLQAFSKLIDEIYKK